MQSNNEIYKEIERAIQSKESQCAILSTRKKIETISHKKNILIIGSGGSFVAGLYAKYLIEKNMQNLCEVLKPMEVFQTNLKLYSYVIIYSYKMANYDIQTILKYILREKEILNIIIFTARKPSEICENSRISYIYYDEDSAYEKKYVSYKGIYLPTFILGSCFENLKPNFLLLNNTKILPNNKKVLDVFYDKDNYCLAQLIERHMCELGIATVRIHEKKDFSHGRMSILCKEGEIIFIDSYNYDSKYDNILINYLEKIYNSNILNINELKSNIKLNYFEKLLMTLYWIKECSEKYGISLENKKDTREDEKLFKYMGD